LDVKCEYMDVNVNTVKLSSPVVTIQCKNNMI